MATFKNNTDYFELIAEKHSKIEHKVNGRVSFFTIDLVDLIAGIKSKLPVDRYTMVLVNYTVKLTEPKAKREIMFFILKPHKKGDAAENVLIRDEAELIAYDVIAKIKEDCTTQPYDPELDKLFMGSMDTIKDVDVIHTEMSAAATKLIGVEVAFSSYFHYCPKVRENIFNP